MPIYPNDYSAWKLFWEGDFRALLRRWLGVEANAEMGWHHHSGIAKLEGEVQALRTELDALKGEIRARNPEPQQVSLRISVDDYEASQWKTLEEFREEKGKS